MAMIEGINGDITLLASIVTFFYEEQMNFLSIMKIVFVALLFYGLSYILNKRMEVRR